MKIKYRMLKIFLGFHQDGLSMNWTFGGKSHILIGKDEKGEQDKRSDPNESLGIHTLLREGLTDLWLVCRAPPSSSVDRHLT